MEARRLWSRLEVFGLDDNEARVYYHLSQNGPQRAAELAEAASLHRTEVYRIAGSLVDKGFAERTLERPVRFAPRPLADVVEGHTQKVEQQLGQLRTEARQILEEWPRRPQAWASSSTRFVVHQGPSQVRLLVERMVQAAHEEVVLVAPPQAMQRLAMDELRPLLQRRREEGVRVRVLTRAAVDETGPLAALEACAEVRQAASGAFQQMVVCDDREIALFVAAGRGTPRQEETVLWLNAREFVTAQKALVEEAWSVAVPLEDVRLAHAEGVPVRSLEPVRGHWVFLARLKRLVQEADGVLLHCTRAEYEAWDRRGLGHLVQGRREQGAEVRLLLDDATGLGDSARSAVPLWPLTVAATSNRQVLAGTASGDETWGVQAHVPELGLWAWHLLQARWDESAPDGATARLEPRRTAPSEGRTTRRTT